MNLKSFFENEGILNVAVLPMDRLHVVNKSLRARTIPEAKSALLFLVPYYVGQPEGNLSLYARSKDYHLFAKELSERLYALLKKLYPENRFQDGSQWHVLSPLADRDGLWNGWGGVNVKYTVKYLANYLKSVWSVGGVVTLDMGLKRSGKFYEEQKQFVINVMKETNR